MWCLSHRTPGSLLNNGNLWFHEAQSLRQKLIHETGLVMVTNLPNEIRRSSSLHGLLMRCIDMASIFAGLVVASRLWKTLGADQLIIAGLAATIAFFTAMKSPTPGWRGWPLWSA